MTPAVRIALFALEAYLVVLLVLIFVRFFRAGH
jgi:hypothetical protein